MNKAIQIAIADDHALVRTGLKTLVETLGNYRVSIEAANGRELIDKLANAKPCRIYAS